MYVCLHLIVDLAALTSTTAPGKLCEGSEFELRLEFSHVVMHAVQKDDHILQRKLVALAYATLRAVLRHYRVRVQRLVVIVTFEVLSRLLHCQAASVQHLSTAHNVAFRLRVQGAVGRWTWRHACRCWREIGVRRSVARTGAGRVERRHRLMATGHHAGSADGRTLAHVPRHHRIHWRNITELRLYLWSHVCFAGRRRILTRSLGLRLLLNVILVAGGFGVPRLSLDLLLSKDATTLFIVIIIFVV